MEGDLVEDGRCQGCQTLFTATTDSDKHGVASGLHQDSHDRHNVSDGIREENEVHLTRCLQIVIHELLIEALEEFFAIID